MPWFYFLDAENARASGDETKFLKGIVAKQAFILPDTKRTNQHFACSEMMAKYTNTKLSIDIF